MSLEDASFDRFVAGFKFADFPFTQFSTENELQIRDRLFCQPSEYSPTLNAFSNGQTMFLIGNRGAGKTALVYDLEARARKDGKVILARIDDFSSLERSSNQENFYSLILQKLTYQLFLQLADETHRIKKLKKEERILLVYLLNEFYPAVSRPQLVETIERLSKGRVSTILKKTYNSIRYLLNYGVSAAVQLTSDLVQQHFSMLPPLPKEVILKQYFPEIPFEANKALQHQRVCYELLDRCLELVRSLDFSRFVVILDKIDEDPRLKNDSALIAEFAAPLLTDNKLLLNDRLQVVVSMWSVPFRHLEDQVRSQKIYSARLTWSNMELIEALNKRLGVFSKGAVTDYQVLFGDDVGTKEIADALFLANRNPRDLWHILNWVFHAQYELDYLSSVITKRALDRGLTSFIQTFNYYEHYPRAANARADSIDVYSYIKHLARLGKSEFTANAFRDASGVSGGSVNNYLGHMQRMGLVMNAGRNGRVQVYRIIDPKLQYAIEHGIGISRAM